MLRMFACMYMHVCMYVCMYRTCMHVRVIHTGVQITMHITWLVAVYGRA